MAEAERILVPLAEGFEEIEAVAIVDVLRRADLDVTVAGLAPGVVRGAHGIEIRPDEHLGELDLDAFTAVVLPGGMPGTRNLMANARILGLIRRLRGEGRLTAAICAAPMVLAEAGVLGGVSVSHDPILGVTVTSHPSVRDKLGPATVVAEPRVVRSGSVVTSQGAGTAVEFALALVADLRGRERADQIALAMCVAPER